MRPLWFLWGFNNKGRNGFSVRGGHKKGKRVETMRGVASGEGLDRMAGSGLRGEGEGKVGCAKACGQTFELARAGLRGLRRWWR